MSSKRIRAKFDIPLERIQVSGLSKLWEMLQLYPSKPVKYIVRFCIVSIILQA